MNDEAHNLPSQGRSREEILGALRELRAADTQWQAGKAWCLVYPAGEEATALLKEAYALFFCENALNPTAFPSLRRMETEVAAMTAGLLGGDHNVVGNMTSGGTESLLLAVKTARDWAEARDPRNTTPEMVLPSTAHPALIKAAHYFKVKPVIVPVRPDFTADVAAMRAAITPRTTLMVGSAPCYPYGTVDPIAGLAEVARAHNLLFHVDACVGGFLLPFVRRLGYPLPDFDFRVPGVTSMSVDLHKYGYTAKGASVLLWRNAELRRHQFFVYTEWPGGIYPSPTMLGTRPGGAIAAAWAALHYFGEVGYLALARQVMETTRQLIDEVNAIPGLKVLGNPAMSLFAIGSDGFDIYEVGDELAERGWYMDRQQNPASLHLTVTPAHTAVAGQFLADLRSATTAARRFGPRRVASVLRMGVVRGVVKVLPPPLISRLTAKVGANGGGVPKRTAALYGMMGALPNRGDIHQLVLDLLDGLFRVSPATKK